MNFCEDCGAKLTKGIIFCENCGAKVTDGKIVKNCYDEENGIIYTNLSLLSSQIGETREELYDLIDSFCNSALDRGVEYTLYDVSDEIYNVGTVEQHVEIIRNLANERDFKYLLILGSDTVIPSIIWENEACDSESDFDISSDLPYTTLDTRSPFDVQDYSFEYLLRTGRIPNIDLYNYFNNVDESQSSYSDINTFALSAEVWGKGN